MMPRVDRQRRDPPRPFGLVLYIVSIAIKGHLEEPQSLFSHAVFLAYDIFTMLPRGSNSAFGICGVLVARYSKCLQALVYSKPSH